MWQLQKYGKQMCCRYCGNEALPGGDTSIEVQAVRLKPRPAAYVRVGRIRRLFRRLGHPAGFRDTLPPPRASASGTALRRARRPAGGSRVLVCMAQGHEGHAERLDPGYRIMGKKKKGKPL